MGSKKKSIKQVVECTEVGVCFLCCSIMPIHWVSLASQSTAPIAFSIHMLKLKTISAVWLARLPLGLGDLYSVEDVAKPRLGKGSHTLSSGLDLCMATHPLTKACMHSSGIPNSKVHVVIPSSYSSSYILLLGKGCLRKLSPVDRI